jgi:hypothetical protein
MRPTWRLRFMIEIVWGVRLLHVVLLDNGARASSLTRSNRSEVTELLASAV